MIRRLDRHKDTEPVLLLPPSLQSPPRACQECDTGVTWHMLHTSQLLNLDFISVKWTNGLLLLHWFHAARGYGLNEFCIYSCRDLWRDKWLFYALVSQISALHPTLQNSSFKVWRSQGCFMSNFVNKHDWFGSRNWQPCWRVKILRITVDWGVVFEFYCCLKSIIS